MSDPLPLQDHAAPLSGTSARGSLWRSLAVEAAVPLLLLAAVIAFFFRALILDTASVPYDIQGVHYPYLQFMGYWLIRGRFPLWNPHVYGGMPLIGDVQFEAFYPLNLLVLWIGGKISGDVSYRLVEWELALHYVLAGWGAYWLARDFKASRPAALLGAFAYMLGPTMASQAQHLGIISHYGWLPWLFLCLARSLQQPGLRWPTLLGLMLAMCVLVGYPPGVMTTSVVLLVIFSVAIVRAWWTSGLAAGRTILLRAIWAALLSVTLSMVQLLPLYQTATQSIATDRNWTTGPSASTLVTLLVPNYFNVANGKHYWGIQKFALSHFYVPPMLLILAAAALASRQARAARWIAFGAVVSLLAATTAILPVLHHLEFLPQLVRGSFEFFEVRKFFDLGLAVLVAIGLQELLDNAPRWRSLRFAGGVALLLLGPAILAIVTEGWIWRATSTSDPDLANANAMTWSAAQNLLWLLAAAAIFGLLLRSASHGRRISWPVVALVLGVSIVPLYLYGSQQRFNMAAASSTFEVGPTYLSGGRTGVVAFLQKMRDRSDPFRIDNSGVTAAILGTYPVLWKLDGVNGANPLLSKDAHDYRMAFGLPSSKGRTFYHADLTSPLLNLLNVRYVILSGADPVEKDIRTIDPRISPEQYKLVYYDFYRVFENRRALPRALMVPDVQVDADRDAILARLAAGRIDPRRTVLLEKSPPAPTPPSVAATAAPAEDASVTYVADSPDHLKIRLGHAPSGMLLVLDPFWPGWVATVDGVPTEIYRADYMFRAVAVGPGDHLIRMDYRPGGFYLGLEITLAALAVAMAAILRGRGKGPSVPTPALYSR